MVSGRQEESLAQGKRKQKNFSVGTLTMHETSEQESLNHCKGHSEGRVFHPKPEGRDIKSFGTKDPRVTYCKQSHPLKFGLRNDYVIFF